MQLLKNNPEKYNYNEPELIEMLIEYINSTYGQHYVNQGIQVVDVWQSMGSLDTTARDTAMKYLARYGKKEGKNRKDLLKAMHYIILMMYAEDANNDEAHSELQ
jgi:hypothetical protein